MAGDPGEGFEHHPVGECGGDVGVVVRRCDLDDVHADDGQLDGDPTDGVEELAGRQATGLGVPVPGAWPGSHTSMSTERKTPSQLWAQLIARPPLDPETLRQFATVIDTWADSLTILLTAGVKGVFWPVMTRQTWPTARVIVMDGYSLEAALRTPGRSRAWAVRSMLGALGREIGLASWQ